ncbi:hypothetical protein B0H11DRAFT_2396856 [Mycena galericulata]|nr:hypothetical protein B0H11DRAFT_2396856 [Mycena galericulata]
MARERKEISRRRFGVDKRRDRQTQKGIRFLSATPTMTDASRRIKTKQYMWQVKNHLKKSHLPLPSHPRSVQTDEGRGGLVAGVIRGGRRRGGEVKGVRHGGGGGGGGAHRWDVSQSASRVALTGDESWSPVEVGVHVGVRAVFEGGGETRSSEGVEVTSTACVTRVFIHRRNHPDASLSGDGHPIWMNKRVEEKRREVWTLKIQDVAHK